MKDTKTLEDIKRAQIEHSIANKDRYYELACERMELAKAKEAKKDKAKKNGIIMAVVTLLGTILLVVILMFIILGAI